MKVQDVENILRDFNEEYDDYSSGWPFWAWEVEIGNIYRVHNLGDVELIERIMGGDGDWDKDTYMVFRVEEYDGTVKYYKKEGHYASFSGEDWDGNFKEVFPTEKVVLVYE
jgi:hypothetical protein